MDKRSVTQRAAEAFEEWPPDKARPGIFAQDSAHLPPATPAEAFTEAVDTTISAWAYLVTSEGRDNRHDAREVFAAAMSGLIDARRRYLDAPQWSDDNKLAKLARRAGAEQ